jgi:hypothetical protein
MKNSFNRSEFQSLWSLAYSPVHPVRSLVLSFLCSQGYWSLFYQLSEAQSGSSFWEDQPLYRLVLSIFTALFFWLISRYMYFYVVEKSTEIMPPLVFDAIREKQGTNQ